MRRIGVFAALLLVLCTLAACIPNAPPDGGNSTFILPEGYEKAEVLAANESPTDGIGVEFDPHFLSQNLSKGAAREDWEIVRRRVKALKLQKFRVQVLPEWYEPENDNDDPNKVDWDKITLETEEMKSLYAVLDLAEEVGAKVNITLWGVSKAVKLVPGTLEGETPNPYAGKLLNQRHFLAQGNESGKSWIMGIAEQMEPEWAENFSILIQALIVKKGYGCVKEITPTNEPSWAYYVQNAASPRDEADWDRYVSMVKKLDAKFRSDGIRDRVLFNLSDDAENYNFLAKCVDELGEIGDMYNSHNYKYTHDTPNTLMREWEERNSNETAKVQKPHFIGEFGSNQHRNTSTKQYDIYSFERGVFLVRQMLNYFNSGAVGMSYWVLFDQYYNRSASYNEFMQLGLWAHKVSTYTAEPDLPAPTQDYQIRNQYYAYGLMTNFVLPGSAVYPLNLGDELVAGTAFLRPDGRWVYAFANNSDTEKKAGVKNSFYGTFQVYEYREGALPSGKEGMIAPNRESKQFKDQCLAVEIPAHSVVLLVKE